MAKRIKIVVPEGKALTSGNWVTARRYADIFDTLGFDTTFDPLGHDGVVALHARYSHQAIVEASRDGIPSVVVLTGTDYQPLSEKTIESMVRASVIVALNPLALTAIPKKYHPKIQVCAQSAIPVGTKSPREWNRLVWAGHLRAIKNPGMLIEAFRGLGEHTALVCDAIGDIADPGFDTRLLTEADPQTDGRFLWHGGVTHPEAQQLIASAGALVVTSDAEGAPNVIAEAIANHTPVLARNIDGCKGMLPPQYPGFFHDVPSLTTLLRQWEHDFPFRRKLAKQIERWSSHFGFQIERLAWKRVLTAAGLLKGARSDA